MKSDRRKYRWKEKRFRDREIKRRQGGVLKHDPLKGSSQAKGIVVEKVGFVAKQPNSGIRKAVKISLIRTGNKLTAFAPGDGAISFIDEHDEVLVEGIGGPRGQSMGDLPGVRYKVIKVNGVSLMRWSVVAKKSQFDEVFECLKKINLHRMHQSQELGQWYLVSGMQQKLHVLILV